MVRQMTCSGIRQNSAELRTLDLQIPSMLRRVLCLFGLLENQFKLLSHAHLLRRVWGHGYQTETEYVRVYVRRLRAKLEVKGAPPLILTAPRAGYRFVAE